MISKKVKAVIKREYLTRIKTKGFIIGTLMLPLIIILFVGATVLFAILVSKEQKTIYVVDQTGKIFAEFAQQFPDTLDNGELVYSFSEKKVNQRAIEDSLDEFRKKILDEEIDGYLYIPATVFDSLMVRFAARNVSNFEERSRFTNAITRIVRNNRLENLGLSPEVIMREMGVRVRMGTPQVTKEGEVESSGEVNVAIAYILTFLLYMTLIIYGQMMMRSVLEEKTQRITETIVSSIKPFDLMAGKLMGICSLAITQLVLWGLIIYIPVTYGEGIISRFAPNAADIINLINLIHFSATTFIFFIVFFILGFVLYAAMFAAIGAIVNTEDEAQQLIFLVMVPIILQYIFFFWVVQHPESTMSFWFSLVPFFTPILMTARLSVMEPQLPDGLFLSVILMIIAVVLVVLLVSKIYRVGILMYGKRPTIKELIKWVKYS